MGLSIVCSSITPSDSFKQLILKNIGINDVEFLFYENKNQYSLTEVYDMGIKDSSYNTVLFIHDDIKVKTKKWGVKLLEHFEKSDYGVLGVAGSTKLPESGRWWETRNNMVGIVNHKNNGKEYSSYYSADVSDNIIPTVILDGLFFAIRKDRVKYDFDTSIDGFHFYDIDYTFGNYQNGCKVGCITNIRVLHESIGETDENWEKARIKFSNKWLESLPKEVNDYIIDTPKPRNIKKQPKVSIIILNKSNNELLLNCLNSIYNISSYQNYEILVGDTGSTEDELSELRTKIKSNTRIIEIGEYHFAKNNNDIIKQYVSKDSELILFMNNDIKLINDIITIMVGTYLKNPKKMGTVGCRLHYGDNTIQHAGIVVLSDNKLNKIALSHLGIKSHYLYTKGENKVFGNTGAALLINKTLFENSGYFDESFKECFEDVELSLRMLYLNKDNICNTDAVAYHYESITRNKIKEKNKIENKELNEKLIPKILEKLNNKNVISKLTIR